MSYRSPVVSFAAALLLGVTTAFADTGSIGGNVIDFNGKPLAGAEVRVERAANKSLATTVKTDAKGQFVARNLPPVAYNLRVVVAGKEVTSTSNIKAASDQPTMVRFDLRATKAAAKAPGKKKKTKYVWVPAQTGSHLGGYYVEVDEDADAPPNAQNVNRASSKAMERVQNSGFDRSMGGSR